jgi:hypothetical protein
MNIDQLIDELEAIRNDYGSDLRVGVAMQRGWPLAMTLHGVCTTGVDEYEDAECLTPDEHDRWCADQEPEHEWCVACADAEERAPVESERGPTLWIVVGESHLQGSPYASKELWDICY